MKYLLKGLALGLSLNILDRVCYLFYSADDISFFLSALAFFAVITLFLLSDSIKNLLLTGFSGLFFMFFCEISIFFRITEPDIFIYLSGLLASPFAIITALVLTYKKVKFPEKIKEEPDTDKKFRLWLLVYAVITAVLFTYLVLPENAGIGVPIFSAVQLVCLWFFVENKKKLLLYIPIFVMSLSSFISANSIWLASNFILSIVLFCMIFVSCNIKNDGFGFLGNILSGIISPFMYFDVPFRWGNKLADKKAPTIKRVLLAVIIAVPCTIILILTLSRADMVFSVKVNAVLREIFSLFSVNVIVKGLIGIVAGLFVFGAVYHSRREKADEKTAAPKFKGDMIIINIVLCAILLVYTMFVIIQFKYLFAGKALPEGLTYTEYARKGFFELLALTGVNIALILAVIKLTKPHSGKWLVFTKVLCHYLCVVTIVMLASSYFRMSLYVGDDGLTRLRLFVMIFLGFEMAGLAATFFYIARPKFNLVMVYLAIALVYYTALNIIPSDYIIAKNQVGKYLDGTRKDISYVLTLSADAVPALEAVLDNTKDKETLNAVKLFIEESTASDIPQRWQRYNLSAERARKLLNK